MNCKSNIIIAIALIPLLFFSCGAKIDGDPFFKAEWIYVNDTQHTIEVKGRSPVYYSFILMPTESYTLNLQGDGIENTDVNYRPPYQAGQTIVAIVGEPWKVLTSGGILDKENYTAEKITTGIGGWKFTYTFTDADFVTE